MFWIFNKNFWCRWNIKNSADCVKYQTSLSSNACIRGGKRGSAIDLLCANRFIIRASSFVRRRARERGKVVRLSRKVQEKKNKWKKKQKRKKRGRMEMAAIWNLVRNLWSAKMFSPLREICASCWCHRQPLSAGQPTHTCAHRHALTHAQTRTSVICCLMCKNANRQWRGKNGLIGVKHFYN